MQTLHFLNNLALYVLLWAYYVSGSRKQQIDFYIINGLPMSFWVFADVPHVGNLINKSETMIIIINPN